jgi:hypothetical protein
MTRRYSTSVSSSKNYTDVSFYAHILEFPVKQGHHHNGMNLVTLVIITMLIFISRLAELNLTLSNSPKHC